MTRLTNNMAGCHDGALGMTTVLTVTDLHRRWSLMHALQQAVIRHQPDIVAFVGDFLHGLPDDGERETTEDCAQRLSQLPCREIIFVRGNHEDLAWLQFAEAWKRSRRPLHALHGETFVYRSFKLIGFPCSLGDESAFIGGRSPLPFEADEWLPQVMRMAGRAGRTLWLMHEPPTRTPLSQAGSVVEGNPDWNAAIERFSPWLTISGHDHVTPIKRNLWYHRVGSTVCVNVGQTDNGPLHYCFVAAEFAGATPSLPKSMKVTGYPWNETISLPTGMLEAL